jgi:hypothetical protein
MSASGRRLSLVLGWARRQCQNLTCQLEELGIAYQLVEVARGRHLAMVGHERHVVLVHGAITAGMSSVELGRRYGARATGPM